MIISEVQIYELIYIARMALYEAGISHEIRKKIAQLIAKIEGQQDSELKRI